MKYLLPWKQYGEYHFWRPELGNDVPLSGCCQVIAYYKYSDDATHVIGTYWSGDSGKTTFDNPSDAKNAKNEEMRAAGYYLISEDKVEAFNSKLAVLL